MRLESLEFAGFCLASLLAFHLFYAPRVRQAVILVSSLAFAAVTVREPIHAAVLAWMVLSGYAFAALAQKGLVRGAWAPGLYIAMLLALFLAARQVLFPGALGEERVSGEILILGFSTLMFKLIHVAVDASQGQLRPVRLGSFLSYTCAWFTWLAGPIPRYNDFCEQLEEGRLRAPASHVEASVNRLVNGAFKLFLLSPWLEPLVQPEAFLAAPADQAAWRLLAFFWGFYVFLYVNFSGYCDLMIALALLHGVRIPENFNRPYLATNLLEYWQRWHMSLSEWFRDYVFNATHMRLAPYRRSRPLLPLTTAYLLTFVLTGIWHGFTANFLAFGLLHGVGCVVLRWIQHFRGRKAKPWPRARWLACLATNAYVAFTLLVFAFPFPKLLAVAARAWSLLP